MNKQNIKRFFSTPAPLLKYLVLITVLANLSWLPADKYTPEKRKKTDRIPQILDTKYKVHMINVKKERVTLDCEAALTNEEKERGLMFRDSLGKNNCMIFVYSSPQVLRFWMKHTRIPLSIAYVTDRYTITGIYDMEPFDERITSSHIPVKYAIEVNKGWFRKNYIYPQTKIEIEIPEQTNTRNNAGNQSQGAK